MFPNVSGSKGSKELPATRCFATKFGIVRTNIWLHLSQKWILGGNTLLTPPVADTKSIGDIHSKSVTSFHDTSNMTHHTHSMKSRLSVK